MYLVLAYISILVGTLLIFYYVWHLTWPTVNGMVSNINEGIYKSSIRGPRKYRMITYDYEYNGERFRNMRQSLLFGAVKGPKVNNESIFRVKHCRIKPALSCPSRPLYDFFLLVVTILGLLCFALVMLLEHWDQIA